MHKSRAKSLHQPKGTHPERRREESHVVVEDTASEPCCRDVNPSSFANYFTVSDKFLNLPVPQFPLGEMKTITVPMS